MLPFGLMRTTSASQSLAGRFGTRPPRRCRGPERPVRAQALPPAVAPWVLTPRMCKKSSSASVPHREQRLTEVQRGSRSAKFSRLTSKGAMPSIV